MKCEHEGCTNEGELYRFPDDEEGNNEIWLCTEHASKYGFCPFCHSFCGGIEFFEVHGICDECYEELKSDVDNWEPECDDYDYDDYLAGLGDKYAEFYEVENETKTETKPNA